MEAVAFITGLGLVTPLGRNAPATWSALLNGRHILAHTRVEPCLARLNENRLATEKRAVLAPRGGETVRPSGPSLNEFQSCENDSLRVISLAREAAGEAIKHASWSDPLDEVAVIACTSKGSIESWLDRRQTPAARGADEDATFGLEDLSSSVARHVGAFNGPRLTLSAACAGGLHGLIRGAMMIQSGEASRVLVVAAEASVHPLFLASFNRLGVLPGEGGLCRPFDVHRNGFLMSEAAAAVCLEAGDPGRGIVAIDRYAMGGDATHLTGSDPDGRVLRHLLGKVIGDQPIDLIHAHGTGTIANDATELNALEAVISDTDQPIMFSHKGALGHSLGASGLLAVVLNCMAHQSGVVPGNITTACPMSARRVKIGRNTVEKKIARSLVHSAGFGGPMAVVSLVAAPDTVHAGEQDGGCKNATPSRSQEEP